MVCRRARAAARTRKVVPGVTATIDTLQGLFDLDDPFVKTREELEPLWTDANNQRFQECRGRVPAVTEIARDSELEGGDDTLSCAGTIDWFGRGAVVRIAL